ncbi:hypothetical protein D9M71_573130 [compost metagenome]
MRRGLAAEQPEAFLHQRLGLGQFAVEQQAADSVGIDHYFAGQAALAPRQLQGILKTTLGLRRLAVGHFHPGQGGVAEIRRLPVSQTEMLRR